MAIFGVGSILGEEDLIRGQAHSSTLTCVSPVGGLYRMPAQMFDILRQSESSWSQIIALARIKEQQKRASYIKSKPIFIE